MILNALAERNTSLTSLDISNNEISVLPTNIGFAHALKRLNLRDNFLRHLPPTTGMLRVDFLSLYQNRMFEDAPRLWLKENCAERLLKIFRNVESGKGVVTPLAVGVFVSYDGKQYKAELPPFG